MPDDPRDLGRRTMLIQRGEGAQGDVDLLNPDAAPGDAPAGKLPGKLATELEVVLGPAPGQRHPLQQAYVVLGALPDCDVTIDDPAVSGRHAALFFTLDNSWRIEDLASTNGTRVNGTAVAEAPLRDGDVIQIGGCALRLHVQSGKR